MRLLLDTHTFLWWREDSPRLGTDARSAIASAALVYVSAATAWEVAIKVQSGKLRLDGSLDAWVEASGFVRLAISFRHALAVSNLPLHHHDPFDRLLIAQVLTEQLVCVTADRRFEPYNIPVIWT